MKSILMFTPFFSPNVGGVETHLDDLIGYLTKKDYQIWVITYQPLTTPGAKAPFLEKKKNLRIYRLPWLKFNLFYWLEKYPILQFLYLFTGIFIFGFLMLLRNFSKIKTIHGHGLSALIATVLLAKIFNKKAIVSLHTIYKFKTNKRLTKIVKPFLLACDKILILAKAGKEDLISVGIPKKKVDFYSNWVDLKKAFKPANAIQVKKQLNMPLDKAIFLFVGRLGPEKGVNELMETIELLRKEKEAFFLIIGDGTLREKIKSLSQKFPERVRWEGIVPYRKLPLYFQAADFLIWASADQDYFGRVTMGALGCGLPVLVPTKTAYFGKWRKVRVDFPEGKMGFWMNPSPCKTAVMIKKLLGKMDNKTFSLMRKKAREYALAHFSEKNAAVFLKAYGTFNNNAKKSKNK